jgi:RNA polymerase sigma factor (sigma-70 family)
MKASATTLDDAVLVEAARGGDGDAFAELYQRYAARLYDFCHSMLRDGHEAADATQDAFVVASRNLGQLRDPAKVGPWLYAIARHQCSRRFRTRKRVVTMDELPEHDAAAPAPEAGLSAAEASTIVWDAAAGLDEDDRALLDLHVRHGLRGEALAAAVGSTPSRVAVQLSRVRDRMERAVVALTVARAGRKDCPTLDALLGAWDGSLTPLLRKRVARHIDSCDVCAERRSSAVSPFAVLGATPLLALPAALRTFDPQLVAARVDVEAPSFGPDGFPVRRPASPMSRRTSHVAMAVAAVALVVLLGGIVVALRPQRSAPVTEAVGRSAVEGAAGTAAPTRSTGSPEPTAVAGADDTAPPGSGPSFDIDQPSPTNRAGRPPAVGPGPSPGPSSPGPVPVPAPAPSPPPPAPAALPRAVPSVTALDTGADATSTFDIVVAFVDGDPGATATLSAVFDPPPGKNLAGFTVDASECAAPHAAGTTCTLHVRFVPSSSGSYQQNLRLNSSNPLDDPPDVTVTGFWP